MYKSTTIQCTYFTHGKFLSYNKFSFHLQIMITIEQENIYNVQEIFALKFVKIRDKILHMEILTRSFIPNFQKFHIIVLVVVEPDPRFQPPNNAGLKLQRTIYDILYPYFHSRKTSRIVHVHYSFLLIFLL